MKVYFFLFSFFVTTLVIKAQQLYQEKFDDCRLSAFCLDCGDTKAEPQSTFIDEIINNLHKSMFAKAKGVIEVQILIDEQGAPCLLSLQHRINVSITRLALKKAINNTSNWQPAIIKGKQQNSSVSLIFSFEHGKLSVARRNFDFTNQSNMKSVGTPINITKDTKLSKTWTLYTQSNSDLPWDMTRAVVSDLKNNIWIGTDNGIVEINHNVWNLYNAKNTLISSSSHNNNRTQSVRHAAVDKNNNKWFIAGWGAYKYDNNEWTKYDSINSPIDWPRKIFIDHKNDVWFTSWRGVSKFDGQQWVVYNTSNANLPTDKTLGVFVDSVDRIWIGTFEGNVVIENGVTKQIDDKASPLSKSFIKKVIEDHNGNLWFSLYNEKNYKDGGIYLLDNTGHWTKIDFPNHNKILDKTSINDFLLDETHQELWVTLNGVGVLCYDLTTKIWEIYTNQNSNIPSIHAEQITKDGNGDIWIATYAGVVKLNRN